MQNGYVQSFDGRMRDELLNESLIVGIDHAQRHRRMERGFQDCAAVFAGTFIAAGCDASLDRGFASSPAARPAPCGATETAEALIASG